MTTTKSSDVVIRRFRPEDLEDVQRLYKETRFYEARSPTRLVLSQFLLTLPAFAGYFSFFSGIYMSVQNPPGKWRYLGIAIALVSAALLAAAMVPIGIFIFLGVQALLKGDMKDVATFYRLRESQKDEAGASSFWVAEVETEKGQKELVGCVGLDYYSNKDKTKAELKRMLVTAKYRGRGIAKKLVNVLLDHAREHKLKEVHLHTTWLNENAVIMYKKTGWEMTKKVHFKMGFLHGDIHDFSWKLDGDEKAN